MEEVPRTDAHAAGAPTKLGAIYAFTFINSLCAGLVTSGIFTITAAGFGFGALENFALGVVLGIMYIVGALGARKFTDALRAAAPGLNGRIILGGIVASLALLAGIPAAVVGVGAVQPGSGGSWAIWVMIGIYSPITGVLWPMVESFLSGGRHGHELRGAIGLWNVIWSSSLVVGFFATSAAVKVAPGGALLVIGLIQVCSVAILLWFPTEPGEHLHEDHAATPAIYADLLTTFRVLLPASYVVSSALGPILPESCKAIGVKPEWWLVVASAWLLPRCLGFLVLERWHGWHGRWSAAVVGGLLVAVGFASTIASTWMARTQTGSPMLDVPALVVLLLGLTLFGFGMAVIYAGAIYYAMEVGAAEVEAGGMHEALIGVGYTGGPLLGVLAIAAARQGWIDERSVNGVVLAGVLGVLALAAVTVAKRVRDGHRKHSGA
jgi:hypothetical protein